jgi:hypothetical protein
VVNGMSWGHVLGPMDDADFKSALEEAYTDYEDWIENAGIQWVMVTTSAGDVLFPLNYFFAYEIDEAGAVVDSEPKEGTADATALPDGLIITRNHYGLVFTSPEDDPGGDTGGTTDEPE